MNVLIVGGGGREHALAWACRSSAAVFCAPGNPGTAAVATNLPTDVADHAALVDLIGAHRIDLTIVGPEAPLAAGLADDLRHHGHPVFGPSARAARLESSKAFAKEVMLRADVPTAASETFDDEGAALAYVASHAEPLVVKASGLAAGKGAIVCETRDEAATAVREMFAGRFGSAGDQVLVEEFMAGEELSVFALTDGEQIKMLPCSQDHKRLLEKDLGPNTGGMGAYCPVGIATDSLLDTIRDQIIEPTLREVEHRGAPYSGVLYCGLMIDPSGAPRVVEFNCRFGDPEAQVVLPVTDSILDDIATIASSDAWRPAADRVGPSRAAVTTVLAAAGYPERPEQGAVITVPDELPSDTILFHAGTRMAGDDLVVSGGRVMCATGFGETVAAAATASRQLAEAVSFDGKIYRHDIAWREVARAGAA